MPEYKFSLICIFPYKERIEDFILIHEHEGQKNPVLWHMLGSITSEIFYIYLIRHVNGNLVDN